jgi:hypothetical protein
VSDPAHHGFSPTSDYVLGSRRAQTNAFGVLEQTCASLPFGDGLTCTGSTTTPTEHYFTGK